MGQHQLGVFEQDKPQTRPENKSYKNLHPMHSTGCRETQSEFTSEDKVATVLSSANRPGKSQRYYPSIILGIRFYDKKLPSYANIFTESFSNKEISGKSDGAEGSRTAAQNAFLSHHVRPGSPVPPFSREVASKVCSHATFSFES